MKVFATEVPAHIRERIMRATDEILPRVLPADWRIVEEAANARRYHSSDGIRVILEVEAQEHAGSVELWLHASFSRKDRVPSYHDQKRVKEVLIGRQRKAVSVLPAEAEHYNYHPRCLHMWSPLDRDPLPDFRTPNGAL